MKRTMKSNNKCEDFIYEYLEGKKSGTEPPHAQFFKIYYLTRGSGLFQVGSKTYEVDAGEMLLVPEGVAHKVIEADDDRVRHILNCRGQYVPKLIRDAIFINRPVVRVTTEAREEIDAIFEKIKFEYSEPDEFTTDMLAAYTREIFVLVARCRGNHAGTEGGSPAVESTLSYIKLHSSEKITLPDMAEMCGVSVAYLSRRFKEEVGIGFADYLSRTRLQRAAKMLEESPDISITEVAFATGFNDSNYFSDKFKRQFGIPPTKYKNS